MKWYKNLSINQRINAKECFKLLCGMSWHDAGKLSIRLQIAIEASKKFGVDCIVVEKEAE